MCIFCVQFSELFLFFLFFFFCRASVAEHTLRSINTSFAFDSVERETYRDDNFFFFINDFELSLLFNIYE